MSRLKQLVQEVHRRSLWQVLGIYVVGGWIAIQVVQTLTESLQLPDWFPAFAVVLLIIGFPIVMATAFIQEGISMPRGREAAMPQESESGPTVEIAPPKPGGVAGMLTWRNAIGGGVVAFAVWGVVATIWLLRGGMPAGRDMPEMSMAGASGSLLGTRAAQIAERVEADLPAIAVLPFANLSGGEDFAFFADGVHEDILTNLSQLDGLLVLSRTSVLQYRDSEKPIREIAAELGATAVLEGSVRRFENQVRITAQLIDAETDTHLWAERYDRTLDDVFAVQSEIALEVARALQATLSPEDIRRVNAAPTEDLSAYDLALEGRQAYVLYEPSANERAISLFKQAIARDSSYGLAWAGLADSYAQYTTRFGGAIEWADSAVTAAHRAVTLAPARSESFKALGLAQAVAGRPDSSVAAYERALELDPNNGNAANNLAIELQNRGKFPEAIKLYKLAERVAPHTFSRTNLAIVYSWLGLLERSGEWVRKDIASGGLNENNLWAAFHAPYSRGQKDSALAIVKRYADLDPADPGLRASAAWVALWAGDLALAEGYARDANRLAPQAYAITYKDPKTVLGSVALAQGDAATGERLLRESLAKLETEAEGRDLGMWMWWQIVMLHALLGESDRAIDLAEALVDRGGILIPWVWEQEAALDPLRENPRFQDLVRRVRERNEAMRAAVLASESRAAETG
ncbi:MAG: tetratricopeptide repeat protein [Gemmatimonadales bacterium]|jgi:TolB-like protein/Flp pilus assembly protein TadD